jgi:hypothetical protein
MTFVAIAVNCWLRYFFGTGYVLYLWHAFLGLQPWGYVTTALVLLVGFLKRKTISAATSAMWRKLDSWFWEKMRTKLQIQSQTNPSETDCRTYKGTFVDYVYKSTPYPCHTLTMSSNGFQVNVIVNDTSLLIGIKRGTLIEVDTEVRSGCEFVRRVRIDETA